MRTMSFSVLILLAMTAQANEVEIVKTHFDHAGGSSWRVDTTLKHDDSGWDHYADAWRVVDAEGRELGKRTLFHPHENEQPFTRSHNLEIPEGMHEVWIEAHDKVHGWSKQRVKVDLRTAAGERYTVER